VHREGAVRPLWVGVAPPRSLAPPTAQVRGTTSGNPINAGSSRPGMSLGAKARVVVLAGPTAVGKSALAMRLCDMLHGELISVDSVQIYRGLHIGANKPSAAEQARVPHHLLDLREANEAYTAGAFYADALRAVEQVLSRGKIPILCGGTSMYMRWLAQGRPEAPKADSELDGKVHDLLAPLEARSDWPAGLDHLRRLDPSRAAQLSRNDWYRLHRALVVAMQTETTREEASAPADPDGLDALRSSLDMRCFFLCAPREPLCRRIDQRCETMLRAGLLEETTEQLLRGTLLPSSPAGRAIGYRQALAYLTRAHWDRADAAALKDFVHTFTAASRRYAAQQVKWFRNEPSFEWVAADWDAPERNDEVVAKRVLCERHEFESGLHDARQAELRALEPQLDKAMKLYVPMLDSTLKEPDALNALIQRADACRDRIEPRLVELLAADEVLGRRFPWHSSPSAGGASGAGEGTGDVEASVEGPGDDGRKPKRRRAVAVDGASTTPDVD
jgi:tRNA dimethylallyltransferase